MTHVTDEGLRFPGAAGAIAMSQPSWWDYMAKPPRGMDGWTAKTIDLPAGWSRYWNGMSASGTEDWIDSEVSQFRETLLRAVREQFWGNISRTVTIRCGQPQTSRETVERVNTYKP